MANPATKTLPPLPSELSRRVTHRYVGAYDHFDEWEPVATYEVRAQGTLTPPSGDDDADPCDPWTEVLHLRVLPEPGQTPATIADAICDQFTKAGCGHDYDCCGCRSYYCFEVFEQVTCPEPGYLNFIALVRSSRNY